MNKRDSQTISALIGEIRPRPSHYPEMARDAAKPRTVRVTLPYPPSTNNLYVNARGRGRVLSAEGRAYKQDVAMRLRVAGVREIDGDVIVTLDFYRPARRGDLDNLLKCCLDSMTGIAYRDDKQITAINARRYEDKANPRVEVTVEPWVPASGGTEGARC